METISETIYTITVVFMCMSFVGILYYILLIMIGLGSNIINMVMFAGAIFFIYVTVLGGTSGDQAFSFIFWWPGVFIISPTVATLTVLFFYIVGD